MGVHPDLLQRIFPVFRIQDVVIRCQHKAQHLAVDDLVIHHEHLPFAGFAVVFFVTF